MRNNGQKRILNHSRIGSRSRRMQLLPQRLQPFEQSCFSTHECRFHAGPDGFCKCCSENKRRISLQWRPNRRPDCERDVRSAQPALHACRRYGPVCSKPKFILLSEPWFHFLDERLCDQWPGNKRTHRIPHIVKRHIVESVLLRALENGSKSISFYPSRQKDRIS